MTRPEVLSYWGSVSLGAELVLLHENEMHDYGIDINWFLNNFSEALDRSTKNAIECVVKIVFTTQVSVLNLFVTPPKFIFGPPQK